MKHLISAYSLAAALSVANELNYEATGDDSLSRELQEASDFVEQLDYWGWNDNVRSDTGDAWVILFY